jgi:hypothetical protein
MITAPPLASKEMTHSVDDQRELICALTQFALNQRPLAQTTDWRYGLVLNAEHAPALINYKTQPCRHCGTLFEVTRRRRFFCSRPCFHSERRARRERERQEALRTVTPESIRAEMVAAYAAYREAVGE